MNNLHPIFQLALAPFAPPPKETPMYLKLEHVSDLNTILAALRYYQMMGQGDPANRLDTIHDIATDGDQISLDDAGIDDLCERINTKAEIEPMRLLREVRRVYEACDPESPTYAKDSDLITSMGALMMSVDAFLGTPAAGGNDPGPSIDDAYTDSGILLQTLERVQAESGAVANLLLLDFIQAARDIHDGIEMLGEAITADSTPKGK